MDRALNDVNSSKELRKYGLEEGKLPLRVPGGL